MNKRFAGLLAFFFVLLVIPLGHALMVLIEHLLPKYTFFFAGLLGVAGIVMVRVGLFPQRTKLSSTILGFIGAVFVWTGWIEFSFVWIARELSIQPLMENGEVGTKPEYLLMLSSLGLTGTYLFAGIFSKSNCPFYRWIQKYSGLHNYLKDTGNSQPTALTTFKETIMIIWSFYILLLFVYNENIAGTHHWATYVVAFGSLFWSFFLIRNLIALSVPHYAIRYAIPTVVIFWNFVEVMGRWNLLEEIWVDPFGHWLENSLILATFILFLLFMHKVRKPVSSALAS